MEKLLINSKAVPRWVILVIDLFINTFSFALSYFVVKHFEFVDILRGHFFLYTTSYLIVSGIVFYCMRVHTCLIRYSNIHDMMRIFLSVFIASTIYPVVVKFTLIDYFNIESLNLSYALLINFFIASSLLIMLRTAVKETFFYFKQISEKEKENVLIFGSGNTAVLVKQAIEGGSANAFLIAGFVETNTRRINTYIEQKKVFGIKELKGLKEKKNVTKLILLNEPARSADKKIIIEKCLELGMKVLTVPPSDQWISGRLNLRQMQELRIEDLLQREPIVINNGKISEEICGKRVLITGAAGSIGSEIVRQVLSYKPAMIVLCDQAESFLHDMQLEIQDNREDVCVEMFVGSVRDYNRMKLLFKNFNPHIVFHAAAYKHVPMMEYQPSEAILTNVLGTKIMADLSLLYKVQKFVMISTDKAVNPTNVMGTSKRIAEMYVQSLSGKLEFVNDYGDKERQKNTTKFITTRFGNVLGSNGSVIPRFREQIQKGGPLTVTHPDITRFFMTIPEAVQLVLEAGIMGEGGEIYIFDMGKPVKIADLARKMIQLAGLVPDEDIKISYVGLRPGEKLFEELLNKEEVTIPTHHEKIKIAKVIPCSEKTRLRIEMLIQTSTQSDNEDLVRHMKALVPEYKSKNSRYEVLDEVTDDTMSVKLLER